MCGSIVLTGGLEEKLARFDGGFNLGDQVEVGLVDELKMSSPAAGDSTDDDPETAKPGADN